MKKIFLLVPLAVLYALCLHAYYVGFFNDDAFYVIGARSLLQGRFVELNHPFMVPMVNYFPGYPLLLAPLCALFPSSLLPLQVLSLFFVLAGLVLAFFLFEKDIDTETLLLGLGLCALNPLTASLSGTVLSELPTFALTPLFFLLARRTWPTFTNRQIFYLSVVAAVGFWIRPTGIVFALAVALALFVEKRWKKAVTFSLCVAILIAPLLLRNWLARGTTTTYAHEYLETLGTNLGPNIYYYLRFFFVETLFRWRMAEKLIIAMGFLVLLNGFGVWKTKGWHKTLPIYAALTGIVYILWSKQAGRYVLPLLPTLLPLFFLGIPGPSASARQWARRIVFLFSLLLSAGPIGHIIAASHNRNTPLNLPPENTLRWIRGSTAPNDIFATDLDGRLYLLTGRQSVLLRYANSPDVRYALLFPTDFVMRTPTGLTAHDPLDLANTRGKLAKMGFYSVFRSDEEGTEVYLRGK